MVLQRRIRPRGSICASWRGCARSSPARRRIQEIGGRLVRPGPLGLELGGEREQGRLVAGAADDLDRERHAVGGEAGRHRHRRVAEVVPGDAVGIEAAHPEQGPERAPPLPAAHRQRRAAHHRRHQHVVGVEDRVDAGGVGLARARRACSKTLSGIGRPSLRHAAGAAFEPLRLRHLGDVFGDAAQVARAPSCCRCSPSRDPAGAVSWPSERSSLGRLGDRRLGLVGDGRRRHRPRRRGRVGDPQLAGRASSPTRRRGARAAPARPAPRSRR